MMARRVQGARALFCKLFCRVIKIRRKKKKGVLSFSPYSLGVYFQLLAPGQHLFCLFLYRLARVRAHMTTADVTLKEEEDLPFWWDMRVTL